MNFPLRSLCLAASLAVVAGFTPLSAQVNDKGTIHLGLGLAFGAHATSYETTVRIFGVNVNQTETDGAATVTVPIEFGVGLSKAISLGLYLEPGRYLDSSATESNGMVMLGLQPRFYLVNRDAFAWLASVQLGVSALGIERDEPGAQTTARYSGGNFGLGTGFVFQFTDLIGLQLHLRYMATNMPLRSYEINGNSISLDDFDATLRTGGVALQASLGFRF